MRKLYFLMVFSILVLSGCGESPELEELRNSKMKITPANSTKKDLLDVPVIQEEPHEIQNYTIDGPISQ